MAVDFLSEAQSIFVGGIDHSIAVLRMEKDYLMVAGQGSVSIPWCQHTAPLAESLYFPVILNARARGILSLLFNT